VGCHGSWPVNSRWIPTQAVWPHSWQWHCLLSVQMAMKHIYSAERSKKETFQSKLGRMRNSIELNFECQVRLPTSVAPPPPQPGLRWTPPLYPVPTSTKGNLSCSPLYISHSLCTCFLACYLEVPWGQTCLDTFVSWAFRKTLSFTEMTCLYFFFLKLDILYNKITMFNLKYYMSCRNARL
jgi:hypothetical protein